MKRPAFQFYPADWRKDPCLSVCSLAARGLWIELMCIAHESAEYGVLSLNGKAMTDQQIARLVGEPIQALSRLLAELEAAGVFSRDDKGAIFSRRMVKDERLRDIRAKAGRLGGNPNLVKQKDKQQDNQSTKQSGKQSPTPSSSSSSSEKEKDSPASPGAELWANAISMLEAQGVSHASARSFVGLQCRSYDDDTVSEAFAAAAGAANVKAYVAKYLQGKPKKGEKPQGVEFRHGQATIGGFVA